MNYQPLLLVAPLLLAAADEPSPNIPTWVWAFVAVVGVPVVSKVVDAFWARFTKQGDENAVAQTSAISGLGTKMDALLKDMHRIELAMYDAARNAKHDAIKDIAPALARLEDDQKELERRIAQVEGALHVLKPAV